MPVFKTNFEVPGSLKAVADFHSDTSALKWLNPPGVIVQMHRIDPMAEESISEFTLWFGPFPIRWQAVHSDVSPNGFTDRMVAGPAASWVHTHRFEAVDDRTTRIYEHIDYAHNPGLMGVFTRLLFSPLSLKVLFAYRAWATRRAVRQNRVGSS